MKLHLLAAVLLFSLSVPSVGHAATLMVPDASPAQTLVACTRISHGLALGAADTASDDSVMRLQAFLSAHGYLPSDSVIGVYGPRTVAAVAKFQTDNGLAAAGTAGPLTRALIEKKSCSAAVSEDMKLSLLGYEMPERLSEDETGAWILKISPQQASTTFLHSVLWGDEGKGAQEEDASDKIALSSGSELILTHAYDDDGRYKQIFNVLNSKGEKLRLITYIDVVR